MDINDNSMMIGVLAKKYLSYTEKTEAEEILKPYLIEPPVEDKVTIDNAVIVRFVYKVKCTLLTWQDITFKLIPCTLISAELIEEA